MIMDADIERSEARRFLRGEAGEGWHMVTEAMTETPCKEVVDDFQDNELTGAQYGAKLKELRACLT